jgi:hypothetical protein
MKKIPVFMAAVLLAIGVAQAQGPPQNTKDRVTRWREDLHFLATELPQRHKNPFSKLPRAEFDSRVTALDADIPRLVDSEIIVRLMQIVSAIGDGHTNLPWWELGPKLGFRSYPLVFRWFSDGLFAVAAAPEYQQAVGARLLRVGSRDVREVVRLLSSVVPHENDSWPHFWLPRILPLAELLRGLGIVPTVDAATFEFESREGKPLILTLAPLPASQPAPAVPTGSLPLYLRDIRLPYWFRYLPAEKVLYIAYNQCRDWPDRPFAKFSEELFQEIEKQNPEKIIFDLRNNTGGDSAVADPLIARFRQDKRFNHKGRLFVAIGPTTFSSAMLNAISFVKETEALLVGEPTGGKPNCFGEVKFAELPNSKWTLSYSTNYFRLDETSDPASLMPHLRVEISSQDFFSGRDPVLAAVAAYKR